MPASSAWRFAIAVLGLAGYALLSHWIMLNAPKAPWAVALLFGPLVLAVAASGWQRRQPLVLAACGAVVLVLAVIVWRGGVEDMNRMYVLQHGGIHLALAWFFGSTLRSGGTPLITLLAQKVHEHMTPGLVAYTTALTRLWTAYFVGMVLLSAALYLLAPWPWWSVFCNAFTPLAVVLLFVGEHLLRYRLHPEFERISLRTALTAYRRHSGAAQS